MLLLLSFCRATLDLRSTRAPTKENTKNTRNRCFCKKSQFFSAQTRSIGCRYVAKKSLTCTNDSPQKRSKFKIFANLDPSQRNFWTKGTCLRHAISPRPDQLETCGLDRLHRQHLYSLSTRSCLSRTSPRETGNNEPQHSISPFRRSGGV